VALFSGLFGRGKAQATPLLEAEERLVVVPIPPLVLMLEHLERQKGSSLTEAEVLDARDNAPSITMSAADAAEWAKTRGSDLDLERVWESWKAYRASGPDAP
jgi:hypothetical protein